MQEQAARGTGSEVPVRTPVQHRATSEKRDQIANLEKRGSRGGRPLTWDEADCAERHAAEYAIARIERHRGVATRGHKLPVRYEAAVLVADHDE